MYNNNEPYDVEDCCFEDAHIEKVVAAIDQNFEPYFQKFIETDGGHVLNKVDFSALQAKFGASTVTKKSFKDIGLTINSIMSDAIVEFEKDRAAYLEFLDAEFLDEYWDDPAGFKSSVMRDKCPIIRSTLHSITAKALEKYRAAFNRAVAKDMLEVTCNLVEFADDYIENVYNPESYDDIDYIDDFMLADLDVEDEEKPYALNGVIGGGIRSHFLYKKYPCAFPNRSRMAIWSLWYLTGQKDFGCRTDSEFLMIDVNKSITQQNYFYPYSLFAFYANHVYHLIKIKAEKYGVTLNTKYRYVIVDAFFEFIASENKEAIDLFAHQIANGGLGYD